MTRHRTLISGFSWCYNRPVLSSNKLTLNCMMRMKKFAHFTVILTFQRLHYYYSAQFQSFHYKFYICHLIAVLLFCNTSLIWRLLLFFGANTMIWPAMRKSYYNSQGISNSYQSQKGEGGPWPQQCVVTSDDGVRGTAAWIINGFTLNKKRHKTRFITPSLTKNCSSSANNIYVWPPMITNALIPSFAAWTRTW